MAKTLLQEDFLAWQSLYRIGIAYRYRVEGGGLFFSTQGAFLVFFAYAYGRHVGIAFLLCRQYAFEQPLLLGIECVENVAFCGRGEVRVQARKKVDLATRRSLGFCAGLWAKRCSWVNVGRP